MTTILPESYRKLMSEADRKALGQPTLEESKSKGEAIAERELQRLCYLELLRRDLFFHWSRMDRKTTARVGTPDFALPIRGKYIAIECKTFSGSQSEDQMRVEAKINAQGGRYFVVHTFDEFVEILNYCGT